MEQATEEEFFADGAHNRCWQGEKCKGGPLSQRQRYLPIHVAEGDDPIVASATVQAEPKHDDTSCRQRTDQGGPKKPPRTRGSTDSDFLPPRSSEENERVAAT